MNVHEYQAKELLYLAGIPVQPQHVAERVDEAVRAGAALGYPVVVKAQVHIGGRGKAGGVKLARDAGELQTHAGAILGMDIKGHRVRKVLIAPAADIQHEMYAGVVLDRARGCPVLMVSAEGGVDIEQVASETPERIISVPLPGLELKPFQARDVAFAVEKRGPQALVIAGVLQKLVALSTMRDASLVEINPLVVTSQGEILALDAKLVADDNALYRQDEIVAYRDPDSEDADERRARENDLSYIRLDGAIGCMVNGAGLAMATMDVIQHFGGSPANFLDIGGSSRPEKVMAAMDILGNDPDVRSILINIFGGITRCDDVARGLVEALGARPTTRPMVVRLTGTNEEAGMRIISDALPDVATAATMDEAVRAVVAAAKE